MYAIRSYYAYIRTLRGVRRVSLFGWSLGGPRAGGYAAMHPEEVDKLVLLAPAYQRDRSSARPRQNSGSLMSAQTRSALHSLCRITSYNVCYTKLLLWSPYTTLPQTNLRQPGSMQQLAAGFGPPLFVVSYNFV